MTFRLLLQELVADCGGRPHAVNTIDEAIALDLTSFGAVLTSYHLAGGTGIDFVRRYREAEGTRHVPVLMFTSEGIERYQEGVDAGVTEFYSKADFEHFQMRLRHYLRRHIAENSLDGHILYVEDSRTDALIMSAHFKNMGLTFDHFSDAESAAEAFADAPGAYDLVITDMVLKGHKSGLDLVRIIRDVEQSEGQADAVMEIQVPILAVTGFDETSRRISLFDSGIDDYIGKPFVPEELGARIRNLVSRHQLAKRVQTLATTDQLTGCRNRHTLTDASRRIFSKANREDLPLSLAVVDLDHFKQINDEYGHAVGDEVLARVGEVLRTSVRGGDIVARFGGEEFIVVFVDCEAQNAVMRAEALREVIAASRTEAPLVTASIGVAARAAGVDCGFDEIFKAADQAVYIAKAEGRNRVRYLGPEPEPVPETSAA